MMKLSGVGSWFRKKGGTRRVAVISGILFVLSQAAIYLVIRDLPPGKLVVLQTTFSLEKFLSIIGSWKFFGVFSHFKAHFFFDFLHPVWYSVFLASLLAVSFNINNLSEKYNGLLLIPFVAGVLDLVENMVHLVIISDIRTISTTKIYISALAANIKWLLAGIGVLMVAGLFFRWVVWGRKKID